MKKKNKENNTAKEDVNEVKDQDTSSKTEEVPDELSTEEKLEEEKNVEEEKLNALNDKYLRLYSEFENFRKRTAKEKFELQLNGGKNVLKDLLVIIDDFERAIANNEKSEDSVAIKEGFQLIYNKFVNVLSSKGVKAMESKGLAFDSDHHEAVANFPAATPEDKGKVIDVAEKGYFLNDTVLRHAKVIVGQ